MASDLMSIRDHSLRICKRKYNCDCVGSLANSIDKNQEAVNFFVEQLARDIRVNNACKCQFVEMVTVKNECLEQGLTSHCDYGVKITIGSATEIKENLNKIEGKYHVDTMLTEKIRDYSVVFEVINMKTGIAQQTKVFIFSLSQELRFDISVEFKGVVTRRHNFKTPTFVLGVYANTKR